ncbi:hypothetical protein DXG01_001485 [Tephrocybe rancida]|nr:hypothetical protein DXG01_001485 [Tephrocybe rancida]
MRTTEYASSHTWLPTSKGWASRIWKAASASSQSIFLVNNYWQVLEILAGMTALHKTMNDQGIVSTDMFHQWLEEERAYLTSLAKEPVQDMLEMDSKLDELMTTWHTYNPQHPSTSSARAPGAKRQYNPETRL